MIIRVIFLIQVRNACLIATAHFQHLVTFTIKTWWTVPSQLKSLSIKKTRLGG
jgi:hypothetical protein